MTDSESDGAGELLNGEVANGPIQMQWGIKIPLRDGVCLNATLYKPANRTGPHPVLFTLTPYVGQTYHDQAVYFATQGFPFLTVDVRGRGNSEGIFKANGNEARDGADIVEWIATQPYCDGQVAMWGGSYGGYVQWATARETPAHLATIVPVAAPYRGIDTPMRSNIFFPYRIQWLTLLAGRTSQDKIFADQVFWNGQFRRWFESGTPFRTIDAFLGHPSSIFQEWLSHPQLDEYWDGYNPRAAQYARMRLPVLTITGIYDGNQLGALRHYREHLKNAPAAVRSQHYLVIGPWDHAGTRAPKMEYCGLKVGPASLVDLRQLHVQWYAWRMQGGPKPDFLKKPVAYYVMGSEKWRYADTLEGVTSRLQPYYLDSTSNPTDVLHSGTLTVEAARGTPDHYLYDPRDVSLAQLESTIDPESRVDHRAIYARSGKHLVYHTPPFESDIEICGFFEFTAWLSIDQPDTDFGVFIFEIGLDGHAIQLTNDLIRARYRKSLRAERLIRATEPLRFDFERFAFVARRVSKGHRLRLVVGPINSIYAEKNYNSGGTVADESMQDARTVTVTLYHDEAHPSALYIPFGQPGT